LGQADSGRLGRRPGDGFGGRLFVRGGGRKTSRCRKRSKAQEQAKREFLSGRNKAGETKRATWIVSLQAEPI